MDTEMNPRVYVFPEKMRALRCRCGVKEFHIHIGNDDKPICYECILCENKIWVEKSVGETKEQ